MPSETVAPGPSIVAPVALTPFTVVNSLLVSKLHTSVPSSVAYARSPPSAAPETTMPGTAVTAPPCAELQPRPLPHSLGSGAFDHTSSPVSIFTARMPPGVGRNVPLTPKYASLPSTAPPHWPPRPLPALDLYSHTFAPALSGSNAYTMPDLLWMMRMSWPFDFFVSIGDAEKSWSGPCSAGQRGLSGFFA